MQPVSGEPALSIARGRALVVADLHIGIEAELRERGFIIPWQLGQLRERLLRLMDESSPDELLILGDVKHNVPVPARGEYSGVNSLLEELASRARVGIVPGNHDGGIEEMVPDGVEVHPARGVVRAGVGLFHGHTWPSAAVMAAGTLVMAHNHPSVSFRDTMGVVTSEQCWLRGKVAATALAGRYKAAGEELVVMPSFTQLRGGTAVNAAGARMLGPIFTNRAVELERMEVYLLDGTGLGPVEGLMDETPRA